MWRTLIRPQLDGLAEAWLGHIVPPVWCAVEGWQPEPRGAACPACGESIGPGEVDEDGCAACRLRRLPYDAIVRLGPYRDPLKAWIAALKYGPRWLEMGEYLGAELARVVRGRDLVDLERTIVVPVPMPVARRWHRGVDHTRVIGRAAAAELGARFVPWLLRRSDVRPQSTLSGPARRRLGGRGFRLARRTPRLEPLHVLLIDDVRTTGTTLASAARRLQRLRPGRIVAGVVAAADGPGRG